MVLERARRAHQAPMRPDSGSPFPLLRDLGRGLRDQGAQPAEQLATPATQLGNLLRDMDRRGRAGGHGSLFHWTSRRRSGTSAARRLSRTTSPPQSNAPTMKGNTME